MSNADDSAGRLWLWGLIALLVALGTPAASAASPSGDDSPDNSDSSSSNSDNADTPGAFELEVRIGGAWNLLSQPADERGEPTLMNGAAFRGVGALGGLALRYVWSGASTGDESSAQPSDSAGRWVTELDLLYARHRATATESFEDRDATRRAILHVGMLHIPLMLGYRLPLASPNRHWQFAGGPVLLQGLHSDIEVEIDGGSGQTRGLGTVDTTHLGLTAQVATVVPAGDIKIPLELRGLWNPLVGRKTLDRLQNYENPQNPGALEANFDWQLLFLTGASF